MERSEETESEQSGDQDAVLVECDALRRRCADLEQAVGEAQRTEAALAESEEKYRQLFATVSDAILVFDAEMGRFIDANESALRLYGYNRDEFLGLTHGHITAEPTASEASIREALTGVPLRVPLRYHKKQDGTVFPVEISAGAFVWGGRRVVCGVIRDITERKRVEAALWRSEANLKRAQQVAHIGSWHLDVIRGELTCSDETYRLFGLPIGSLVTYGRFLKVVHPADREAVAAAWRAALTGQPTTIEHRIVAGKEIRWIRESAEVEFDEGGTAIRGIGTAQDITAQRKAEDALRARTQQLEALRAVSAEITRVLDLPTVLELITHRAIELVGGTSGTIYLWDAAAQVLTPQVWSAPSEWIREDQVRLGEGLANRVVRRREGLIVNDYRNSPLPRTLDQGHTNTTAVIAEPLLYRDRLLGVLAVGAEGMGRRFTEQDGELLRLLAAQAAIAIENARLFVAAERAAREARSLYEVAHSLTTSLDPMEVLRLIVAKTRELLGTPHGQVVLWDAATQTLRLGAVDGTAAEKVKVQEFRLGEGVNGIVAQTRAPLIVNDYQAFLHRVPELIELTAVIGIPLLYRGQLLGVLTSHTTQPGTAFTQEHLALLTSFADQAAIAIENARLYAQVRQHAEELEQKVEDRTRELQTVNTQLEDAVAELEAFSYSVSHDLRTPLVSIGGFSRLILKRYGAALDAKGKDYLQRVVAGAQRMEERIDALLALARATSHPIQWQPVDLSALARAVAGDLRQRDADRPAEVTIQDGLVVQGDARLLRALFENLLGNAWKFTAHRHPARIEVGRRLGNEGVTVFFVQDNGAGFDMANADKIFGAFQRLHTAQEFPGTGIGLATVQRIVQRHRGRVWAEGVGDRGATFYFTIGSPDLNCEPRPQTPA